MSHLATGTFTVDLQPMPFEGADQQSKLARMSIDKQISGDLVATTKGQMLSVSTDTQGSAGYVAMEHVTGALNGRKGSFVLQHNALMTRGVPSLTIIVVPDSGTGELVGLTGNFEIVIRNGQHDYRFAFELPPPSGA